MCVCVCVCVERERDRERESIRVLVGLKTGRINVLTIPLNSNNIIVCHILIFNTPNQHYHFLQIFIYSVTSE